MKGNSQYIYVSTTFVKIFLFLLRFVITNTFKKKKTIEVRQSIYLRIYMLVLYFFGSHWRCFIKRVVLKNFSKFTGKHLCQSLFLLIKLHALPATLLKKRFWRRCFPLNFEKFLRTLFSQNLPPPVLSPLGRLLLIVILRYYIV